MRILVDGVVVENVILEFKDIFEMDRFASVLDSTVHVTGYDGPWSLNNIKFSRPQGNNIVIIDKNFLPK